MVEVTSWVEEVEKMLLEDHEPSSEVEQWRKQAIYRVPARIKRLNGAAYKPQMVSLGPFHHGDPDLVTMEMHKRRALLCLLRRAGRPLRDLLAAVGEVKEQLRAAYVGLGDEWRGGDRFVEMMIVDGCFLLEVMRMAAAAGRRRTVHQDYAPNDPVFSRHGLLYMVPYVQRDMLMVENQLPLLVLQRIFAAEGGIGKTSTNVLMNRMVLNFLGVADADKHPALVASLGLHPLDIYRRSLLHATGRRDRDIHVEEPAAKPVDVRSARKLHESGIRFRHSGRADCLRDVRFYGGTLTMPQLFVDDSTEYKFLNLMAFEALHVGAGGDVTAYVFFMRSIVGSVEDVRLLRSKGIVRSDWVDGDETVVRLLNDMTKDVVCDECSPLCAVQGEVEAYCRSNLRVFLHVSWCYLRRTYFGNPWTFLSLAAGVLLLVTDIIQTVYAILSYEVQGKREYHDHN
ncbi:hypothetical protein QYE76_069097 [Lolium multiflorum]|uniref:Uncharacterized protein n=1 Tax=Lolium multiflorum TaxID=4521 RepID=A0AAD8SFN7_LOLMU|nr:hypothetical protein QYE76_069097 [Lolium multiflorum]